MLCLSLLVPRCAHLPCRPEIPFGGLPALMQQIRADIGVASGQLDAFAFKEWRDPANTYFFPPG